MLSGKVPNSECTLPIIPFPHLQNTSRYQRLIASKSSRSLIITYTYKKQDLSVTSTATSTPTQPSATAKPCNRTRSSNQHHHTQLLDAQLLRHTHRKHCMHPFSKFGFFLVHSSAYLSPTINAHTHRHSQVLPSLHVYTQNQTHHFCNHIQKSLTISSCSASKVHWYSTLLPHHSDLLLTAEPRQKRHSTHNLLQRCT